MPTENHSGSMSKAQKHMEGQRPASPQPHGRGRGRDGQAKVEHICPGWWALEWTHGAGAKGQLDGFRSFGHCYQGQEAHEFAFCKDRARQEFLAHTFSDGKIPVATLEKLRDVLRWPRAVEVNEGFLRTKSYLVHISPRYLPSLSLPPLGL
ncbi:uncharacterized protein PG998_010379 [Apiospora kogelbergensis]|uniref:uncharacterized protein n=1 Tax=Apiospora kogelbergensis TaxID=1337665 RepID=UPI00312F3E48